MLRVDPIEKYLFLEGIFLRYGYDFRGYSEASMTRRLVQVLTKNKEQSLLTVLANALSSKDYFREILPLLTINTTEFFRDPLFFKAIRENVLPVLASYPSLRVWVAGCSTGEEVISVAILLQEAGLLNRSVIYATDINPLVLTQAKQGIFPIDSLKTFAKNYSIASGLHAPTQYYFADYGAAKFDPELLENVVFSEHNLVTDSGFVEAHLILCRNVMIYFSKATQNRVFQLFTESLIDKGFLERIFITLTGGISL